MKEYKLIPLGDILEKRYDEDKIICSFKKFSCYRELDLENFLANKALPYQKTGFGKTYLCVDAEKLRTGEFVVMAYFTIAQKALDISCLSQKKKRKVLGEYPGRDSLNAVPAFLIGQFGRSDQYTNDDLSGTQMLLECYHVISLAAKIIGGKIIVLECREHMYEKFYEKHGFIKLYTELNNEGLYTLYQQFDFSNFWN